MVLKIHCRWQVVWKATKKEKSFFLKSSLANKHRDIPLVSQKRESKRLWSWETQTRSDCQLVCFKLSQIHRLQWSYVDLNSWESGHADFLLHVFLTALQWCNILLSRDIFTTAQKEKNMKLLISFPSNELEEKKNHSLICREEIMTR